MTDPLLLTFAQVKRLHGVPVQTLHKARQAGNLRCQKYGDGRHAVYLVDKDELDRWLQTWRPRGKGEE